MTGTETGLPQPPASSSASHTLAGFRYQLLQSIAALLGLQEGEKLLLEVFEDFSVVSTNGSTDVQVKNSQAAAGPRPFSLQSSEVRSALGRFWQATNECVGAERRLVFLARGGAAVEKAFSFPNGVPGLVYWQAAAIDADTTSLRHVLQTLFPGHPLGQWLESNPSDAELRSRLLRRVSWQLDEQPADALVIQTRDQVSAIYNSKNLPVSAADPAVKSLLAHVFEVASRPNAKDRVLDLLDLHRVLEGVVGVSLIAQAMVRPAPMPVQVSQDILISENERASSSLAPRSKTVIDLLARTSGEPLLWLHGSHGVGKSTLARLLAQRAGGRWLVLDLQPVQKDAVASVAAWRELLRAITSGTTVNGIIVDDFALEAANVLRPRLAALVRTVSTRGGRVIVTSHQAPSPAHLLEFGSGNAGVIQAPYMDEEDIAELVRMLPAPGQDMVRAWSTMIFLTTGGGQPVLVAAKVVSLRARAWPKDALVEDLGSASQAVRLTREEARRSLLRDLRELDQARSLDAGHLLRRLSCVFDRADDGLIRQLFQASPTLINGGDALAVLRGTWLEVLPHGDLRVSPLLADLATDVPPIEAKGWRRLAAEYWLAKRVLNERTLPLCFWNAFWGEHDGVLMKLCEIFQTMPREKMRAAAPLLSPMTALVTDKSIYARHGVVAAYLRLLQFDIADAIEEAEVAGSIAARLLVEIEELGEDAGALLVSAAGPKVLMAGAANIPPALRIKYALRIRDAWPRVEKLSKGQIVEPRSLLPPQFDPQMDIADFLFATVVQRTRGSQDALEAFQALDDLPANTRNRFIDAASAIYSGPNALANCGWSQDQLKNHDMTVALDCYDNIASIVSAWERLDLQVEIACARSVILDEGLKRLDDAMSVINEATANFGPLIPLVRQKSKLLGHAGRYVEATELLLSIEDQVGLDSPLDRALALRDGGVLAAKANRFGDAVRLFDKAHDAIGASTDGAALAGSFLVEKALVLWRAGDRAKALTVAGDALDAVEAFPADQSRQAERSHQYARAIVGLFFSEQTLSGETSAPPFSFGHASSLEANAAKLLDIQFKSLADNWRILTSVEAALGMDVKIETRSMAKQTGTLNVVVESNIRANRYAAALQSGNIERAFRAGLDLVNSAHARPYATPDAQGQLRVEASQFSYDPKNLLADSSNVDAIQTLVLDILLARAIEGSINGAFLGEMSDASKIVFGNTALTDSVVQAAADPLTIRRSDARVEMLARGIAIPDVNADQEPSTRFFRDMMIVGHLAFSLGRLSLAPQVASKIARGWQFVLDHQRFRLRNPRNGVPAIEAAIATTGTDAVGAIAELLLAAADSVEHPLGDGWIEMLKTLRKTKRSARPS